MVFVDGEMDFSAEERLLLLNFVCHFYRCKSFEIEIKELESMFCTTKNTVTSLTKKMDSLGWLKVQGRRGVRGRAKNSYTLTEEFLALVEDDIFIEKVINSNDSVVNKIITHGCDRKVDNSKISPEFSYRSANRLFLLILYIHADSFGIVKGLSVSKICKLMGNISRDRFKSQLAHLYDVEAIKTHIPGVTGKELFGKVKGCYYLNFEHLFFIGIADRPSSIIIDSEIVLGCSDTTEASLLIHAYWYFTRYSDPKTLQNAQASFNWHPLVSSSVDPIQICQILPYFKNKALHDQLQAYLLELSSLMLTHHRDDLDVIENMTFLQKYPWAMLIPKSVRNLSQLEGLNERTIETQILEKNRNSESEAFFSTYSDEKKNFILLCRLIVKLSNKMAIRYKALVTLMNKDIDGDKWVIVPHDRFNQPKQRYELLYCASNHNVVTTSIKIYMDNDKMKVALNNAHDSDEAQSFDVLEIKPIQIHRALID